MLGRIGNFQQDIQAFNFCTGSAIYIGLLVKFLQFLSPFQKNFKTNDISYESPYKGRLESGKKLGVAPS